MGFLSQWKVYLDELSQHEDGKSFSGKKLDPVVFEKVCRMVDMHLILLAYFGTPVDDQ